VQGMCKLAKDDDRKVREGMTDMTEYRCVRLCR